MSLLRYCWSELKYNPRFVIIFVLNSALGLIGLLAIENFRSSFNSVLEERSQQLLGADIAVSARQGIPEGDAEIILANLPPGGQKIVSYSLFSMAAHEEHSRLVSVRSIERPFPFYGEFVFSDETRYPTDPTVVLSEHDAWIDPELSIMLQADIGSIIKIGNTDFTITKIIEADSLQAFQEGAMASRVYISSEGMERAGLVGLGSTYNERWYFSFPELSAREGEGLVEKINGLLTDPAVRIRAPRDSSEQVGRTLNYLNDFLGLVSLVALFLSSVGLFYLFRSYLHHRREDMAILSTLGMSSRRRYFLFLSHLLILGLLSVAVSSLAALVLFPILSAVLSLVLPFALPAFASWRPFALVFVVAIFGNLCLSLPLLYPTLKLRALEVFQSLEGGKKESVLFAIPLYLPWLIFYWVLSVYVSHSLKVGSSFVAVFIGVALLIFPLGHLVLTLLQDKGRNFPFELRLILRSLCQFKLGTLSLYLSLVLGTMLLTMVPTIEHNLRQEIEGPESSVLPSLFLFDIQEDQLDALVEVAQENKIELRGLSPMIQGRLVSINDESFRRESDRPRTREEEQEFRIRNRGVNLTYRAGLDDSETLVRGRNFEGEFSFRDDQLPEVTVEYRYARRMGMSLGDKLEFEILDMPFEAIVVGIREVRWTTFMPNFFIVFQPGVLEDAPKTYLSVVPSLPMEEKIQFQRTLVQELRNISIIDIGELVQRIFSILEQMAVAMQLMAWLSVTVGLFVLYSLVQNQMQYREKDITLLKVLGVSFPSLKRMIRFEFFFISFTASLLGGLISIFVTWVFAHLFFDGLWSFTFWPILSSNLVVTVLGVTIAELASGKSLLKSPQSLLQEGR